MADPNPLVQMWGIISPHVTGGSIGIMGTIILCTRWVMRTCKPLVQWASVFRIEHDILWEDFNLRTGGPYRRPETAGRGGYTGRERHISPRSHHAVTESKEHGIPETPKEWNMASTQQIAALRSLYEAAKAAGHIFPAAAACEGVVETAWGTSSLGVQGNNIFGMKQHAHPVYGTVILPTKEFLRGAWVTVNAPFVKYPTVAACFADRMDTLRRLAPVYPHYAAALAATTPEQYLTEVSAQWSTGPTRGQDCISILHAHADVLSD